MPFDCYSSCSLLFSYFHMNCSTLCFTIRLVGFTVRDCEKACVWVSDQVNHTPDTPLSPMKLSTESMDIVHGLSGHCPWTQWALSMDSVVNFHGLSGHCPVGFWLFLTHTLYRAITSEGMLMFSLQCMSYLFHDMQCL